MITEGSTKGTPVPRWDGDLSPQGNKGEAKQQGAPQTPLPDKPKATIERRVPSPSMGEGTGVRVKERSAEDFATREPPEVKTC